MELEEENVFRNLMYCSGQYFLKYFAFLGLSYSVESLSVDGVKCPAAPFMSV